MSDSDSDREEKKLKLEYNNIPKEIDIPDNSRELLKSFIKVYEENENKKFELSFIDKYDNNKKKIIDENNKYYPSDFENMDKVFIKEIKTVEKDDEEEVIEEKKEENIEEEKNNADEKDKIKLEYNGITKDIDKPEDYNDFLRLFLNEYKEKEEKKFEFFYYDKTLHFIILKKYLLKK